MGAPSDGCAEGPGLTPEHGPEGVLKPGDKVGSGALDSGRGHSEAGFCGAQRGTLRATELPPKA